MSYLGNVHLEHVMPRLDLSPGNTTDESGMGLCVWHNLSDFSLESLK